MRVAHLVYSFSKLSETFIYDVVTTQRDSGVGCEILTFERENIASRPFPFKNVYEISQSNWDVRRYWNYFKAKITNQYSETANWGLYRKQLKKKLITMNPDVIHAHFGTMGVLMMPVIQDLQIPLVVSFHGRDAFELPTQAYWRKAFEKLFYHASAVTVVSKFMRDHLVNVGCSPDKISLIHVGKRVQEYPLKNRYHTLQQWVSVGRLSEKKGFFDCLNALSQLIKVYPDAALEIIGDGPLEKDLKEQACGLGISENVRFLGAISHQQVIERLTNADAFILCSKTSSKGDKEGIPTVLMEAQAIGLPCVSTFHSGIPEVIPPENQAFLAPEGDIDAITQCMKKLYECSPEKREQIAKAGRLKIEEEFNIKLENEKLVALYHTISSNAAN